MKWIQLAAKAVYSASSFVSFILFAELGCEAFRRDIGAELFTMNVEPKSPTCTNASIDSFHISRKFGPATRRGEQLETQSCDSWRLTDGMPMSHSTFSNEPLDFSDSMSSVVSKTENFNISQRDSAIDAIINFRLPLRREQRQNEKPMNSLTDQSNWASMPLSPQAENSNRARTCENLLTTSHRRKKPSCSLCI